MPELVCPLLDAAEQEPDTPAIIAPHRIYSYRKYHEYTGSAAVNLRKHGLGEGDVLGLAMPTGLPYPLILTALLRLRATACPLNTRFPVDYMLRLLELIRCKDVVVPYGTSFAMTHGRIFSLSPTEIVDESTPLDQPDASVDPHHPAFLIFTSGSTGTPKAAVLSFNNIYQNALRANANMPLRPGDRWLLSLPLYHVSGLSILIRCIAARAAVVIPGARDDLQTAIHKYGVTHLSLVPAQLYRLMQSDDGIAALRSLTALLIGGAAISEGLLRRAHALGLPIYTTYGLTEMASQVCTTAPHDSLDHLLTSGRPLAPDGIRISPQDEIEVRGESLFLGYLQNDRLHCPTTADGWFATGDLGQWTDDGYLQVLGRRDNMFIVGGENVQPEEVEHALRKVEGVRDAVVVPAADDEFGTIPVAFLQMDNPLPDNDTLRSRVLPLLPRHKVPRYFFAWPDDLDGKGLKVQRASLVARAQELLGGS
ncbi:MAG: o-succinylbenzoate--CoA ligase [Candidatus Hydrogenedentes bacterium]|nr:o-succinylbenzoate--CoA ligase [Candidatus Hydrogenedentota bacterium]